ncbi:hypothetical protein HYDPIDRAFT_112397 [Hydnomerulius pinastri MD-312]|uniref:Uncharacterized protein n=1 Tax=Hydnomerulius pinastri MD-312 TaxID=994086 RepID=A0A0C9W9G5_9AGAM|nr:hypothetical protein HYDPIDRAFT_112397 [Hydnomerulius pinastri MD-312]
MEFAPSNLNLAQLRRKMDIRDLTLYISGHNDFEKGRFYVLWKNGNFIVIQAEPYCRPGIQYDPAMPLGYYVEEYRAFNYLKEVLQTMLDTIVFDSEYNWAHLVRQKDNTYRLVYTTKRCVHNCPMWTKVVDLNDIEVTRITVGVLWEGIYEGKDVDIFIGWEDTWGSFITAESKGHKLMQSLGLGHYTFEVLAHVSKNGIVIGLMTEAYIGRGITRSDRSAVFEAVAAIQRHGILMPMPRRSEIYITDQGVRFSDICGVKWYKDHDKLAKIAETTVWEVLADMFDNLDDDPVAGQLNASRYLRGGTYVIPRLPTPGRPVSLSPEQSMIHLAWSIAISDELCRSNFTSIAKLQYLYRPSKHSSTARRDKRAKSGNRALLPPDDVLEGQAHLLRTPADESLVISLQHYGSSARTHPYARPTSKRLLLA